MVKIFEKITNAITEDKVRMVGIEKLRFDEDFKGVFAQEPEKVSRIAEDMKTNGFDRSQPIIITEGNFIIDGNSRFMAAQKAGIKKVPVIMKTFESKEEALIYEYNLQLNRRNLKDSEIFAAFQKLDELRTESGEKAKTNADIAAQLSISERQVSKLREVMKKASDTVIEKLKSGALSLNRAYVEMKIEEKENETTEDEPEVFVTDEVKIFETVEHGKQEGDVAATQKDDVEIKKESAREIETPKASKEPEEKKPLKTSNPPLRKIDIESFSLGVKFALGEFSKEIRDDEIFGNEVVAKTGISSRKLSKFERTRILKEFDVVV